MTYEELSLEYGRRAARTLLSNRVGHGQTKGVVYRQMNAAQLATLAAVAWRAGYAARAAETKEAV